MKKLLAICVLICIFCLSSCSLFVTKLEGIDAFGIGSSDLGLCNGVMPRNMDNRFEYIDANHFFLSEYELTKYEVQKVLLYFTYNSTTYESAKECVNNELYLVKRNDETESKYTFYNNLAYKENYTEGEDDIEFPSFYRMVAFCDDSCTIVFYGLFIPDNSVHLNKDSSPTTFDEHLKYFYDDWYDFFS